MRRGLSFVVVAALLAPIGAGAATRRPAPRTKASAVPPVMQSCAAHKFETVVHATVEGQPRGSRVKLCGVAGQSDADWINTLRDAIRKLQANKEMAPAVREQIVAAINAEIGRLSILGTIPPRPRAAGSRAPAPLSRDYSALPPLPPPVARSETAVAVQPAPAAAEPPVQQNFAQLPAVSPAPVAPPIAAPPPSVRSVAPRLTFGCDTPGEITSDAPCADFQRETVLTIHARDDVPAGTLLQFVRNDRSQAEVALDGLRRGRALRTALPREVCRGFTSGKLELRIVRGEAGSEVLASDGPYSLRC